VRENTGDGAGILLQLPHTFLAAECKSLNIKLPEPGHYAVGMVFLPQDADARADVATLFARIVEEEGQTLLGWRDVPTNPTPIGKTALKAMPFIRMAFVAKSDDVAAGIAFERKLYVIRKRTENAVAALPTGHVYFPSLSSPPSSTKGC